MKRTKIFLGVTTGILAVAGVAAAKYTTNTKGGLYITQAGTYCKYYQFNPCTQGGLNNCKYVTSGGLLVNVFTDGPEGVIAAPADRCKSLLKYSSK